MLTSWLATNIRPGEKQGAVEKDGASPCLETRKQLMAKLTSAKKEAADGKKIIERLHRGIKLLEKRLSLPEDTPPEETPLEEISEVEPNQRTPLEVISQKVKKNKVEISFLREKNKKGQQSSEIVDPAPPVKKVPRKEKELPKYRGWAFVHEKNFVQKNIFEDTIVDSRLRKRN